MDWRSGSNGTMTALQAQSPEIKSQSHQKKKKEKLNIQQKAENNPMCSTRVLVK
jgi:hypothetical protein